MPTYDYVCAKCGHAFEKVQSMKDDALTVCPKEVCPGKKWGKGKVNRQVGSGAGLIFKGSGFYITDYRSEGYKQAAKKDAEASKAPSTPAATSSDTKAAKPAAATPAPAAKKTKT